MSTSNQKPASILSRCKEALTCSVCKDTFQTPISLPCTHNFCLPCLEFLFKNKKDGDEIPCPRCLRVAVIPNGGLGCFPVEPYVNGLLYEVKRLEEESQKRHPWNVCGMCSAKLMDSDENEILQSDLIAQLLDISPMQCSQTPPEQGEAPDQQPTEENQLGVNPLGNGEGAENGIGAGLVGRSTQRCGQADSLGHYCYECDLQMCEKCAFIHSKIPEADKHDVKTFKSKKKLDSIKPPICQKHSPLQIRYYCYDCAEVGCRQCISKSHLNHAYANLKEASQRDRANIEKLFSGWLEPKAKACLALRKELSTLEASVKALSSEMVPRAPAGGPINWLKRKFYGETDKEKEEEGQLKAKKQRLEEQVNGLGQDIEMMEDKLKVMQSYKVKVESLQTELTYASVFQSTQIIAQIGEKEFNDFAAVLGDEREDSAQLQPPPGGLLPFVYDDMNPLVPAPAARNGLERCLVLVVEYGKCRFLWKQQLYSVDNPMHYKKMKFAPCIAFRGTLAYISGDTIYAVSGGRTADALWEYSHFAGRWSKRTEIPEVRRGVGVIQANNKLYFFGGGLVIFGQALRTIQTFNLITNRWEDLGVLASPVSNPMCLEYKGIIYLFGGRINFQKRTRVVQTYDPATRQSVIIDQMPCRHPFHVVRWKNFAIFVGRVAGCVYDLDNRTWHSRRRYRNGMYYFSVDVIDNWLYIVGGRCYGADCWRYVDMRRLRVEDFVYNNNPDACWSLVATYVPNKQRRQQRYKCSVAGAMRIGFS